MGMKDHNTVHVYVSFFAVAQNSELEEPLKIMKINGINVT